MGDHAKTFRDSLGISSKEFARMGKVGAKFFEQGDLHKARTIFEGLVEMDPESADAHSALGAILTLSQQDGDAVSHLETAIEMDPKQIAPFVNLGEVLLRNQRLEDAVEYLKIAIALDPEQDDPGANRARAMMLGIMRVIKLNGPKALGHSTK